MSEIKDNLFYTKTNEWLQIQDNVATIGIDDHSQKDFGEIVYVDLPKVGYIVAKDDEVVVVESVKTATDICSPISGRLLDINTNLTDKPKLINESCYDDGWIIKIEIQNKSELDDLMSADEYKKFMAS